VTTPGVKLGTAPGVKPDTTPGVLVKGGAAIADEFCPPDVVCIAGTVTVDLSTTALVDPGLFAPVAGAPE
jgi:hypothetical protein